MERPVFISYARAASAADAQALAAVLGPLAFFDTESIDDGDQFPARLLEGLLDARVVVVFATKAYSESRFCRLELRLALSGGNETSSHVLVARGSGAEVVLEGLPETVANRNWPAATATSRMAALVQKELAQQPTSIRRTLSKAVAQRCSIAFLEESNVPEPKALDGIVCSLPLGVARQSIGARFVGRASDLRNVHQVLSKGAGARAQLTSRIVAGAGFGKTQLAVEYLHRYGPRYYPGGLFWVNAASGSLEGEFWRVLRAINPSLPIISRMREQRRDTCVELERALSEIKQPILYVIDGIPEASPGEEAARIEDFCPAIGHVTVLATSRQDTKEAGVETISVGTLSRDAAILLLTENVPGSGMLSWTDWGRVAAWVGNLPVALDLLNRALAFSALSIEEVLGRVNSRQSATAELDLVGEALRSQVPRGAVYGITEVFRLSLAKLDAHTQKTAKLLGHLAAAPIPQALLDALPRGWGAPKVRAALRSRHFVTSGDDRSFGVMHSLLADFLRNTAEGETDELLQTASTALLDVKNSKSWVTQQPELTNLLRPHAELLFEQLANRELVQPNLIKIAAAAMGLALAQGDISSCRRLSERTLEVTSRLLGDRHSETLASMFALGMIDITLGNQVLGGNDQELEETFGDQGDFASSVSPSRQGPYLESNTGDLREYASSEGRPESSDTTSSFYVYVSSSIYMKYSEYQESINYYQTKGGYIQDSMWLTLPVLLEQIVLSDVLIIHPDMGKRPEFNGLIKWLSELYPHADTEATNFFTRLDIHQQDEYFVGKYRLPFVRTATYGEFLDNLVVTPAVLMAAALVPDSDLAAQTRKARTKANETKPTKHKNDFGVRRFAFPLLFHYIVDKADSYEDLVQRALDLRETTAARKFRERCRELDQLLITGDIQQVVRALDNLDASAQALGDATRPAKDWNMELSCPLGISRSGKSPALPHLVFYRRHLGSPDILELRAKTTRLHRETFLIDVPLDIDLDELSPFDVNKYDGRWDEYRKTHPTASESLDDVGEIIDPDPSNFSEQRDFRDDDIPDFGNDDDIPILHSEDVLASDGGCLPSLLDDSSDGRDFDDDDLRIYEDDDTPPFPADSGDEHDFDHDGRRIYHRNSTPSFLDGSFGQPECDEAEISHTVPVSMLQVATEHKFIVVKFSDVFADTGYALRLRRFIKFGFSSDYAVLCDGRNVRDLTDKIFGGVINLCKAGIPMICLESEKKQLEEAWNYAGQEYANQWPLFRNDSQLHIPLISLRMAGPALNYVRLSSDRFREDKAWKWRATGEWSHAEEQFANQFLEGHYNAVSIGAKAEELCKEERAWQAEYTLEDGVNDLRCGYKADAVGTLRAFQRAIQRAASKSFLVEYFMSVSSNSIQVAPYHSRAIYRIDAKNTVLLARPAIIADKTASLPAGEFRGLGVLLKNERLHEDDIRAYLERHPAILDALKDRQIYMQIVLRHHDSMSFIPQFFVQPTSDEWWSTFDIKLPPMQAVVGSGECKTCAAALHELVAQLREYAPHVENDRFAQEVERLFGVKGYRPCLIGVFGTDTRLADEKQMRHLMTAYSDVEELTFDQLLIHAQNRLLI